MQQLQELVNANKVLTQRLEASEAELMRQKSSVDQAQQLVTALGELPDTLQQLVKNRPSDKKVLVDAKGLGKPWPFNNVESDFLKWSRKTANYMNSVLKGLAPILQQAIDEEEVIKCKKFKDGVVDILVCTDLGGRGLHVEGVQHVINFDAPKSIATYQHRIGRTGRAGLSGIATTFLTKYDELLFHDLVKFLKRTNSMIPEELENHPMTSVKPGKMPQKNKKDSRGFNH